MEVVQKNFKQALPLVTESIKNADFMAIDIEFSGLMSGVKLSPFDTPEEYYSCLLNGSMKFLPIQFGLCTFQWDVTRNHYAVDAYNFYLLPRENAGSHETFMCQVTSLNFLASCGFDFNKLIVEGISYSTGVTETKQPSNGEIEFESYLKEGDDITVPEEHKSFIEETRTKVRQFIDDNKSDEMEIDKCNSFVRLLLYQELRNQFKDDVCMHTKVKDKQTRLYVTRTKSTDGMKLHNTQKNDHVWSKSEEVSGFSKVAQLISLSEKLVIGHNMILDVLHSINKFFQPLPTDYGLFKELTHFVFPSLLDTKYMASLPPFKDKIKSSVLQHLLVALSEPPFSLPNVEWRTGNGYSLQDKKQHEAGYDAYITGLCFLAMLQHLSSMRGEESFQNLSPQSAVLKPFLNKLYLSRTARHDSPYINLVGPDPTPSRDHVFHLTFPKKWQRDDIHRLFIPFSPVAVYFLDDTSALVALHWRDKAQMVLRPMSQIPMVRLLPYNKYKTLLDSNELEMEVVQNATVTDNTNMNVDKLNNEQALTCNVDGSHATQPVVLPEKVARERTNTVSSADTEAQMGELARKRTSSGVFLIQDNGIPAKKSNNLRSNPEISNKRDVVTASGHWSLLEVAQSEDKTKDKGKVKKNEKVIERFESEASTNCVSGYFKESDSWE